MNLILIPVYNDWKSLNKLLLEINKISKNKILTTVLIVNDNSSIKTSINSTEFKKIKKIEVLNLEKNVGSQKAIAIGLNYLSKKKHNFDFITVMDGDGEDDPRQIDKMVQAANKNRNSIIVSCRKKRKENFLMRFFYKMHLLITFLVTGNWISFGNFSCFFSNNIVKILSDNSVWYAYSAAIKKNSKITRLYAARKKRYYDNTKVNFLFLVFHSIRIIGVFYKRVIIYIFVYLFIINFLFNKYLLFLNSVVFLFLALIFIVMNFSKKEKSYKFNIKRIK